MSKKDIIHWTNAHAGNDVVTADFWFVNRSQIKVKTENQWEKCQKYLEREDFQSQRLTKRKKRMPKKFKGENSKAVEAR